MADDYAALADLVTINDANLADIDVIDLLDRAPFIRALAAETASNGTSHKYVKETGAPVVGFRAVNDGRDHDSSVDTAVTVDLKILDASFTVDKALADSYTKGGASAWLAREGKRHLKAAFFKAEQQLINGDDASGFDGMADATTVDAVADGMVIDAGGTTVDTASSVWAVRTNGDGSDVSLIVGQDGNLEIGETVVQRIAGSSTGWLPAYFTPVYAWLGLQVGSIYSMGRIVNLTEDADKGLTDALLYKLLEQFPSDKWPSYFVMNRRSARQLRESRTATNATGQPAPWPGELEGIPFIITDAIQSDEALVA